MTWFGDIYIPMVVDKSTDISRDVVEKDFVDSPSQVYELNADLESGTYSVFLNEQLHERDEEFSEQRDAILSMSSRDAAEFPFRLGGDIGHIMVESSTASITPSEQVEEGEITLRYLDKEDYIPAFITRSMPFDGDFDVETEPHESILPISSDSNVHRETVEYTIESDDGDLDYILYDDERDVISYENPESDFDSPERVAPVRVFQDGERIYSDLISFFEDDDIHITNSLIKLDVEDNIYMEDFESDLSFGFYNFESTSTSRTPSYISKNGNFETEIVFPGENYSLEVLKGFIGYWLHFNEPGEFLYECESQIESIEDSGDFYVIVRDSLGIEYMFVNNRIGNFQFSGTTVFFNYTDEASASFFVGIVPDAIEGGDLARYIYNRGLVKRTFVQ